MKYKFDVSNFMLVITPYIMSAKQWLLSIVEKIKPLLSLKIT